MTAICVEIVLSLLFGLILLAAGRRLYIILAMVSALIVCPAVSLQAVGSNPKGWLIAAITSAAAVAVISMVHPIAAFIAGASAGILIVRMLGAALHADSGMTLILMAVFAVFCGFLAVTWKRFFLILSTSCTGSSRIILPLLVVILEQQQLKNHISAAGFFATLQSMDHYLFSSFLPRHVPLVLLGWLVLAAAGFFIQLRRYAVHPSVHC